MLLLWFYKIASRSFSVTFLCCLLKCVCASPNHQVHHSWHLFPSNFVFIRIFFTGNCCDLIQAVTFMLQRYGSLLSRHMFHAASNFTLSQRVAADKFVLSVRGQLRLIDLESGSSSVWCAVALLSALSRHLAVNHPCVSVNAYYACIDDVVAVRESLFMQSWSPATDSRIVLLSVVIMRLFSQFYERMQWQPARDSLAKVFPRFCA
jgi:hypothetical protein